jgi:hypothetical protein
MKITVGKGGRIDHKTCIVYEFLKIDENRTGYGWIKEKVLFRYARKKNRVYNFDFIMVRAPVCCK